MTNEIDSRDPQWNYLFDKAMPLPEGCHILISKWGRQYLFELIQGDKTITMSHVYPDRFHTAKYMVRAAVKRLVYDSMEYRDQLLFHAENIQRIEEELDL
jgi:hypothetical protein